VIGDKGNVHGDSRTGTNRRALPTRGQNDMADRSSHPIAGPGQWRSEFGEPVLGPPWWSRYPAEQSSPYWQLPVEVIRCVVDRCDLDLHGTRSHRHQRRRSRRLQDLPLPCSPDPAPSRRCREPALRRPARHTGTRFVMMFVGDWPILTFRGFHASVRSSRAPSHRRCGAGGGDLATAREMALFERLPRHVRTAETASPSVGHRRPLIDAHVVDREPRGKRRLRSIAALRAAHGQVDEQIVGLMERIRSCAVLVHRSGQIDPV
jgi:hypothetical protein